MEQLALDLEGIKQEIKEKLNQTAENFVFIGYRLRQILDAGAYIQDGYSDIYEFAKKEFSLGKSAVSRFMAINEKYSEGGYGPKLREEFTGYGSSKLSEMLTLTDEEIGMITEDTTVSQIRDYKQFKKEEPKEEITGQQSFLDKTSEEDTGEHELTPLLKDYFKNHMELLRKILFQGIDAEDVCEEMNPAGTGTYKHRFVFLMMHDFEKGISYKKFGKPEPVKMTWHQLCDLVREQLAEEYGSMAAEDEQKKREEKENRRQQEEEAKRKQDEQKKQEEQKKRETEKKRQEELRRQQEKKEIKQKAMESSKAEVKELEDDTIPGQDSILNHEEYIPEEMKADTMKSETPEERCCDVANEADETREKETWEELKLMARKIDQFISDWNQDISHIPADQVEEAVQFAERETELLRMMLKN